LVAEDLAAVSLVDTLPAGVAFVAASDGGTVGGQLPDGTGGTVTWPTVGLAAAGLASTDGDVTAGAPGSWVTRTVTVRVEATAAGDVVNTASASAPDPAD